MILTDRDNRQEGSKERSTSRHSIESKSQLNMLIVLSDAKTKKGRPIEEGKQKQNVCRLNLPSSTTDTPEFSQSPVKFEYDCQQIYALLESVKIDRNHEDSLELICLIRNSISKLSSSSRLKSQVQDLERILACIQRKLGCPAQEKGVSNTHLSTTHHQIQFSLVSNWKETSGKQVVYSNFSLVDSEDDISFEATRHQLMQEYAPPPQRDKKSHQSSVSSNVLITDLKLQIEMLDSLLEGRGSVQRRPRLLHTSSVSSETIKKNKPQGTRRNIFY